MLKITDQCLISPASCQEAKGRSYNPGHDNVYS